MERLDPLLLPPDQGFWVNDLQVSLAMATDGRLSPVRDMHPASALERARRLRRNVINELHFTNRRMVQLLPALALRSGHERLGQLLSAHSDIDRDIGARLVRSSRENGDPPTPCTCEEAHALLANVYYADRNKSDQILRRRAVVQALKSVRAYMIRSWGALIDLLSTEVDEAFRKEALALQQEEASLHRGLVVIAQTLDRPS